MDHLPLPTNPTLGQIDIPYLCQKFYDGGPFETYPVRHGWELSMKGTQMVIQRHGNIPSKDEIRAFLQTWLYFGLISDTIGNFSTEVQSRFVSKDSNGNSILTSKALDELVVDWGAHLAGNPAGVNWKTTYSVYWSWLKRIVINRISRIYFANHSDHAHLQDVFDKLSRNIHVVRTVYFHVSQTYDSVIDKKLCLAQSALVQYLASASRRVANYCLAQFPGLMAFESKISFDLLKQYMLGQNWCPSDVCRIKDKIPDFQWFFANLPAPRGDFDHSRCSDILCLKAQISSMESYELSHTDQQCKCGLVKPEKTDIHGILSAGDIPVLRPNNAADSSERQLAVLRASESNYVCISHTWADGLGDPYDNALHHCEVKRLFGLINCLPVENPCLWIDTLCVPVEKSEAKNNAILKMRDTYRDASGVLILDAYLLSFEAENMSLAQIFSLIENSTWCRRLWTLQEGRLNNRVWFQFKDGPVDSKELVRRSSSVPIFPVKADYDFTADVIINNLKSYRFGRTIIEEAAESQMLKELYAVRIAVRHRSLSVSTDEALCLGFLMAVDMQTIVNADLDKRMDAFWRLVPKIPKSIVFSRAPSKLTTPGLEWAPSSFLQRVESLGNNAWLGSPSELWNDFDTTLTESGLIVDLPGLFIRPQRASGSWSDSLLTEDGSNYFKSQDGAWFSITSGGYWNQESSKVQAAADIALILNCELEHLGLGQLIDPVSKELRFNNTATAVVVVINHSTEKTISVSGFQHALVTRRNAYVCQVFDNALDRAEKLLAQNTTVVSDVTLAKQCKTEAIEALLDPDVKLAAKTLSIDDGSGDFDEEVMYQFAGIIMDFYNRGYNASEAVGKDVKWCIR